MTVKRDNSKEREPISDEQWDRWKLRIVGGVISFVGIITLILQLLVVDIPTETKVYAALGMVGIGPLIGSLDRKGSK